MRYDSADSDSINFRQNNPDAPGPALVLLHGAGSSLAVWPKDLREMPHTHTVALDLPGHGHSSLPGRRTIRQYADAVTEFLRNEALPDVIIAGHSMGGAIALELALRKVTGLRGFVLLGCSGRLRVGAPLFAAMSEDFAEAAALIADLSFSIDVPADLRQVVADEIIDCGPMVTIGDFMACNNFDLTVYLPEIALPALVISGTADRMVPYRFSAATAAALSNATLQTIEGAGHFVMQEAPDEVALLVESFVRQN